ncbi:MAG: hypothetical protein CL912_29430 [Deltaproteobacteria bacterium]|nr:hypothetical protein [Deltaproteobacteria bacterium]
MYCKFARISTNFTPGVSENLLEREQARDEGRVGGFIVASLMMPPILMIFKFWACFCKHKYNHYDER